MPKTVKDWNSLSSNFIFSVKSAADPVKSFAAIVRGGISI